MPETKLSLKQMRNLVRMCKEEGVRWLRYNDFEFDFIDEYDSLHKRNPTWKDLKDGEDKRTDFEKAMTSSIDNETVQNTNYYRDELDRYSGQED